MSDQSRIVVLTSAPRPMLDLLKEVGLAFVDDGGNTDILTLGDDLTLMWEGSVWVISGEDAYAHYFQRDDFAHWCNKSFTIPHQATQLPIEVFVCPGSHQATTFDTAPMGEIKKALAAAKARVYGVGNEHTGYVNSLTFDTPDGAVTVTPNTLVDTLDRVGVFS